MKGKFCVFFALMIAALAVICNCTDPSVQKNYSADSPDFSTLPPAAGRATSGSGTFTVLSYNINGLPAFLQYLFKDEENGYDPDPETFTPIIGTKVSNYDIVNVQEDFNYHASLYEHDTHPYRTATSGGAGIGSGLNTMSRFEFCDDTDRVPWNTRSGNSGNNLTPKGFTWLRLRMEEGVYIDVYNLHTGAGSTAEDLEARRDNINQLVTYINTNSRGNALLVFGDTNCRYTRTGDNIRNMITAAGALDSWIEEERAGVYPEQGSPALVWEGLDPCTHTADYEVVDKIFYRGNNYITLTPAAYDNLDSTFRTSSGYMLSDHRPVYTEFEYTLSSELILSDQFGGPHGTSYSDVDSIPSSPVVTALGIRTGSRVDQVNLTLSDGTSFSHGGTGGTPGSLTLNPGEYVKSVYMCSGKHHDHTRIFYIELTTSAGRTLSGGTVTGSGTTYTAPSGWQIAGFHGRAGDELDKMGVIYAPVTGL